MTARDSGSSPRTTPGSSLWEARDCTCGEGEACSNPGCRGPYYDEIVRLREAIPSDAELRRHVVRERGT